MQLLWSVTLITSLGDSEELTSTLGTNAQDRLILLHQDWWIGPKQKQIPPPATCYDDVTHEVDVHAINDRRKGWRYRDSAIVRHYFFVITQTNYVLHDARSY
jgi:hypothetical protein